MRFRSLKPTILYCLPWDIDQLGGVSQVVQNLLRETVASGTYSAALLVTDYSDAELKQQKNDGQNTFRLRVVSVWNVDRPWRHLVTLMVRWPGSFMRTVRMLREIRPAAVNVHYVGLSALTLLWALRLADRRVRLVLSFHGSDLNELENAGLITRQFWHLLLDSADAITCCSQNLRARLLAIHPKCRTNVAAIHNGIDLELLDATLRSEQTPLLTNTPYIINVATLEYKKGQDVLVRAWKMICDQYPEIRLVLVGRPDELLEPLRSLITELQLSDRVQIIPGLPHSSALNAIQHAELFVLSSRQEPFGIVLLEASYLGTPIVASRVGGIPEIIDDGVNGLLVDGNDSAAMAVGIAKLLGSAELRKHIATNARITVERRFTWKIAFLQYASVLFNSATTTQ